MMLSSDIEDSHKNSGNGQLVLMLFGPVYKIVESEQVVIRTGELFRT